MLIGACNPQSGVGGTLSRFTSSGTFRHHDLVVKLDSDTVFSANRLRGLLGDRDVTTARLWSNSRWEMGDLMEGHPVKTQVATHGPMIVMTSAALDRYAKEPEKCHNGTTLNKTIYSKWGEDWFLATCLTTVLGAQADYMDRQLLETQRYWAPHDQHCFHEGILDLGLMLTISRAFLRLYCHPTPAVWYVLLGAHADRMMVGVLRQWCTVPDSRLPQAWWRSTRTRPRTRSTSAGCRCGSPTSPPSATAPRPAATRPSAPTRRAAFASTSSREAAGWTYNTAAKLHSKMGVFHRHPFTLHTNTGRERLLKFPLLESVELGLVPSAYYVPEHQLARLSPRSSGPATPPIRDGSGHEAAQRERGRCMTPFCSPSKCGQHLLAATAGAATAVAAAELRLELAAARTNLLVAAEATAGTTLAAVAVAVAAGTEATTLAGTGTTTGAGRPGRLGAGSALEGVGYNLGREVEVVPEVLDALVGERPVEVAPRELLVHVAAGLERLHGLDDHEVRDAGELGVLGRVEILLRDQDAVLGGDAGRVERRAGRWSGSRCGVD